MNNNPLSAIERAELNALNINMTELNKRYQRAKHRAKYREQSILPLYAFYRELINQLKKMAKTLNIPEKELLPLVDIHSINGYVKFKLLLREEHQILHSKEKQNKAKEILTRGSMICRHCNKDKKLNEFVKSKKTYTGYVHRCKKCDGILRKEKKNVEAA